jgi:hypothetical protein
VFTDGRHQRQPNHSTTTYYVYWLTATCRCCRPSVNTICGLIMIGFIVVVVRQWTQYVVVLWLGCRCVFTEGRQKPQPNHNTTTYCVYWRTTTTINPVIIRPRLGCRCPSVNTICGRIMIVLSLLSVSKHNMWSYCDWIWRTKTTINPVIIWPDIVFTDERERQPNHNMTTYCVYWQKTTTTQS